jgi:hypothetical protein
MKWSVNCEEKDLRELGNVDGALRCEMCITAALYNVRSLCPPVQSHAEQYALAQQGSEHTKSEL